MARFQSPETDPILDIEPHYHVKFNHDVGNETVGAVRDSAVSFLQEIAPGVTGPIHSSTIDIARLCISEAFTNPVKEPGIRPTDLAIRLATGRFAVTVGDSGKLTEDLSNVHNRRLEDNKTAEGGRGFLIIDALTDSFGFRHKAPTPIIRSPRPLAHIVNRALRPTGKEFWFIISTTSRE